uniref:Prolyl endopeptidase n=1 Tax=Chlamydomonas euryale TaxID=1486919 RepID=A0A7R9W150_9CHLO|mmetsp:Transcript_9872/g.29836  ORF Transcript_9872/g.29836 Transcript_9872/m.29836 type:complete len:819 (+) Transcript_9872:328-2784(+)
MPAGGGSSNGIVLTASVGLGLAAAAGALAMRSRPALMATASPLLRRLPLSGYFGLKTRAFPKPVAAAAKGAPQTGLTVMPDQYPDVRRDESIVETLHGMTVADPYRWLENPDAEETQAFVAAQNKLTQSVLKQCDTREKFKALFTKLYDYPKFGMPHRVGDFYTYYHNSGLQQQYVLYTQTSLDAEPRLLLDPNLLSDDGTVSLNNHEFSDDGKYMCYSLSSGGSDWCTIQVMSIGSDGKPTFLDDRLEFVKFSSLAWTLDNKGFFYNRFPDPKNRDDLGTETDTNTNQLLCYHVLGAPQSEDAVVYAMPDHPTRMCGASVTDDGRFMMMYVSEGCEPTNRIFYVDLEPLKKLPSGAVDFKHYDFNDGAEKLPVVKLVDNFDASYSLFANDGTVFYFRTNLNAPRYKVVKVDVSNPGKPSSWPDVVPQHTKDVLQSAAAVKGDHLVTRYLRDACGVLQLRKLSSGEVIRELPVPGIGGVGGFSGDRKYSEFFFQFQSFAEPGATYRMDLADGPSAEPTVFRRTELKVPHNPDDYITQQVFVTSKDGTKVPLFVTHLKTTKLDGTAPCLLYGYGGFSISLLPVFSASRLAFMRGYGGVFAQACLRGGNEYGRTWRDAGSKQNKQNVFDDFQACAEHLHAGKFCSPSTLTIQGGSNGGLLVAACANQRPDLYACVLAQVGVMDMLRFHKFTIGHAWCTDFGNPDLADEFEYIFPYSPLHNVRPPAGGAGQYPAMLMATGDHDDRVVPLHSHKLTATLQHVLAKVERPGGSAQRNPLLSRIDVRAGHGAGKPTAMVIEETSDLIAFAAKCMGAKWDDGASV